MVYMCALVMAFASSNNNGPSDLKHDEVVQFFPTYAFQAPDQDGWQARIHGWVYEPEVDSLRREALLGLLRRVLNLERTQLETALFKKRARGFLVDNERRKHLVIRLEGKQHPLLPTTPNGHTLTDIRVDRPATHGPAWGSFEVVLDNGDERTFSGRCQFIPPEGLSVISDIDDTVKITGVNSEESVLRNTFLREFEAVEGMPELYGHWAASGAVFHYVSASPWQLCHELDQFFARSGLPRGSMHLRPLRFKDKTLFEFLGSSKDAKITAIATILNDFPHRQFILIGDSTDRDPEVYGHIARTFPGRVTRILIRMVDDAHDDPRRFEAAFEGLPAELWRTFRQPHEAR